jgi:hypothetical protein
MVEEKTKERFPDRNNRENNRDNSDRKFFPNVGHSDRNVDQTTPSPWPTR